MIKSKESGKSTGNDVRFGATKTLSKEQIDAIVDEFVSKLNEIIDNPLGNEEPEYDEDDYGHCYNDGINSISGELEEICIDGLPGIENCSTYITATYNGNCKWHDSYDPGDYLTPPSGGIEIDSVYVCLDSIQIEVSEYDENSCCHHKYEISDELKNEIMSEVNRAVA